MNLLKLIGGGIVEAASSAYQARTARKSKQDEFENAVHIKKLEAVEQGKINEATWNQTSIQKAGWRPGFLTVLIMLPIPLAFFPWFVPHIEAGFLVLQDLPLWYSSAVGAVIASAFGLKKLSDIRMSKKYE